MSSTKILIADDHPIIATGLRSLIHPLGMTIVGTVDHPSSILDSIATLSPDVLISEVRLSGKDVIKSFEPFCSKQSNCKIIFYSSSSNSTSISRAATVDCFDYILKTSPAEDVLAAIKSAASKEATPEKSLLKKARARNSRLSNWDGLNVSLTSREKQVLQHVATGLSNREVGRSLEISVETVKEHVQNILRKLEANDRTQAAVWAVRQGVI